MLLGQKKEVLKNFSKSKFSKGVCPWILSKIELFIMYYVFFWGGGGANQARKDCFLVFWIKKESFLDQKKKVLKKYKKSKFSKGVSLSFLSKNRPFYRLCFLEKSRQGRSFFLLFWIKRSFLDQKKEVLKNKKIFHSFCQKMEIFVIY